MAEYEAKSEAVLVTGPIVAPRYAVAGFQIIATPTDITVLASSLVPVRSADGEITVGQRPELLLSMSPQAAKELMTILASSITALEAEFGEYRTPFLSETKAQA